MQSKMQELSTTLKYLLLVTDPENYLRRLRRQYTLILRGERASKKRDFFVIIFQKVPKNGFQNFACGAENLAKTGTF